LHPTAAEPAGTASSPLALLALAVLAAASARQTDDVRPEY
jgi:MYXO-CTERM domain-containing protein